MNLSYIKSLPPMAFDNGILFLVRRILLRFIGAMVGVVFAFCLMDSIGWKYQKAESYKASAQVMANASVPKPVGATVPVTQENPMCTAGKIRWHRTFAEAQLAAGKSKKPIFLFEMLGKLDEEFC